MNLLPLCLLFFLSACSNSLVTKDPAKIKAPFDGKQFSNLEPVEEKGFLEVLKWRITRDAKDWPDQIQNAQFELQNSRVSKGANIVIINHATALIQINGLNILTDPIYSDRCSPVSFLGPKRVIRPGIAIEDLPKIDLILISHNHYDHLDLPTIKALANRDKLKVLVGLGNGPLLEEAGVSNVVEVDWWDQVKYQQVGVHFVPAQHWSARRLFDRKKTLWGGYVVEGDKRIYFAGDTGYGKFFGLIRDKIGIPDVALLPIGAYEPRWFMRDHHLNPMDAVKAYKDLQAKMGIGIHFGTFEGLTDEGITEPATDLQEARRELGVGEDQFIVPVFGKSYLVP